MADHPLLPQARALPEAPGVYIMRDHAGTEIYVGKAKNLRRRVSSYFQTRDRRPAKEAALLAHVARFEHVETDTELEAFLLESRLIKDFQPKYNVLLRDREGYPFLEITWDEDFPRVLVAWRKEHPGSRYYGPYVGVGGLRPVIATLQRLFLFRVCNRKLDAADPRLAPGARGGRACLNFHLKRCAGPCVGKIGKDEYRRRVAGLCRFLEGGKKELLVQLRGEMADAARALRFEEAARLRDQLHALETMNEQPALDPSLTPTRFFEDPAKGVASLREALGLPTAPERIEGIDIANLMGKETVGSLVCFMHGAPFKEGYRRFRIKTVDGQDDFACIAELVRRRYGKLAARAREDRARAADGDARREALRLQALAAEPEAPPPEDAPPEEDEAGEWTAAIAVPDAAPGAMGEGGGPAADAVPGAAEDAFGADAEDAHERAARRDAPPDLILIDGGKGQLGAAAAALAPTGFRPLALLSLAKAEEIVYRWDWERNRPEEHVWSRRHPALKLLQRIRDESHRFAQHYHHILRRKAMFNE